MSAVAVETAQELAEAVVAAPSVLAVGAGTKPALSSPPPGTVALDVRGLRGIVEYDPAELTLTARAGTPLAELADALSAHGQYLPFDPPLVRRGATLGGTVAAGLSGPGAYHYGGVRDCVLGVQFVDGTGQLVRAGGRVVKNAAGFDLPKLLVGSAGRLGILAELSVKVLPAPQATTTLAFETGGLPAALALIARLGRGPIEADAIELEPPGRVIVRLGGRAAPLAARAQRLAELVGLAAETLEPAAQTAYWQGVSELLWVPEGARVVRVGLRPRSVPALAVALDAAGAAWRLSNAANVAWVAWPDAPDALDALDAVLGSLDLAGMTLTGERNASVLGAVRGGAFAQRIRAALDPDHRFPEA